MKHDIKCECGLVQHWDGPISDKWVQKIRCQCGKDLVVQTEEEAKAIEEKHLNPLDEPLKPEEVKDGVTDILGSDDKEKG